MRLSQPFFILPSRLILSLGLDKYVLYGLRKTPTAIYPANSAPSGAVTLTHPVDIRRTSPINTPVLQDEEMALSGTGIGGSGCEGVGKVDKEVVKGAGHMVPLEKVRECASLLARWVSKQMDNFKADEQFYRENNSKKSERGRFIMSKDWMTGVRQKADAKRPVKQKL